MFGRVVTSTNKCNYEKYHSEKLFIKINRYRLGSGAVAFHSGLGVIGYCRGSITSAIRESLR